MAIKQISRAQAIAFSFKGGAFIKPAETQEKAIKRLMSGLASRARKQPIRVFPKTEEALASPQAYARAYFSINDLGNPDGFLKLSANPTEYLEDENVDYWEDLIDE